MDKKTKEITEAWNAAHQLNRIANAMEEILRLVKVDQARTAKRFPEPETDELSKEWKV